MSSTGLLRLPVRNNRNTPRRTGNLRAPRTQRQPQRFQKSNEEKLPWQVHQAGPIVARDKLRALAVGPHWDFPADVYDVAVIGAAPLTHGSQTPAAPINTTFNGVNSGLESRFELLRKKPAYVPSEMP